MKVIVMLSAMLMTCATAAPQGDVSVQLEVLKVSVSTTDGKETLRPADAVLPGDTLEYRAHYRNQGKTVARDVEATLPIPANNVIYVADSARPRNLFASTDGVRFETAPLKRVMTRPDGQRETRFVPLTEYRSLRWKLGDLPAGSSTTVTSRMRVAALEAPPTDKKKPDTANGRVSGNATSR